MKVLVIDDDEVSRALVADILEAVGCVVVELPSAIGATSTMLREKVDVVVLDVMMPTMSGDKMAKLVRSNPRLGHVGVILVSGTEGPRMNTLAEEVGAVFIGKGDIRDKLPGAVEAAGKVSARRSAR